MTDFVVAWTKVMTSIATTSDWAPRIHDMLLRLAAGSDTAGDGATLGTDGSRNLGRPGISSMAISTVDSALWDLKARLLNLPFGDFRQNRRRTSERGD